MSGFATCLRHSVADSFRANSVVQATAARALWIRAGLERRNPTRRLALLARAAHLSPPGGSLNRRLCAAIRSELDALDPVSVDWNVAGCTISRTDLPKAIILKPPVSAEERGLLHIAFEDQWLRLLRGPHAAAVARRYDLLLGPSWSPPPDLALLLAAGTWPGRVFTLLSNFDDAAAMTALSDRLVPVPLLASSWVNPAVYDDYLGRVKVYDIVMLANFARFKRHWLFFHTLRSLPRNFRVLLLGVPLGDRNEQALRDEARAFGVEDRFDLIVKPTRAQVVDALCRAKATLIFSRREGSCIAVAESLFADTPVGLFRDARIGSQAFINEWTGHLLDRRGLPEQIVRLVEESSRFRARSWAMEHISCYRSHEVLNDALRAQARRDGRPWTRDVVAMQNDLVPAYLDADTAAEMEGWNADFARRYGIRVGTVAASQATAEGVPLDYGIRSPFSPASGEREPGGRIGSTAVRIVAPEAET
jgi:glycosyltransferase involved in cell wall biosynthesis